VTTVVTILLVAFTADVAVDGTEPLFSIGRVSPDEDFTAGGI
jgi:hypothetical protein